MSILGAMSRSRYVFFGDDPPPFIEFYRALRDYLGALCADTSVDTDVNSGGETALFVTALLVGAKSCPYKHLESLPEEVRKSLLAGRDDDATEERWIELFWNAEAKYLHVTTRRQDEATNDLADGYARLVARIWQARLEME